MLLQLRCLCDDVPKTVSALWSDFDPRKDKIDAKVVREWEPDVIIYRYVTYSIGTFKGEMTKQMRQSLQDWKNDVMVESKEPL